MQIVLYILLFLIFLSILITIHELGHLLVAKAFKVYCFEFSIGMGPLLFKKKRKNGETQFSIRAIPFGGYVSMFGEGVEVPDGIVVEESRSLNGIKPWKRALVLLAGVTMNAILALVFFAIHNCFPFLYRDQINVVSETATIPDKSIIKLSSYEYEDTENQIKLEYTILDAAATINGDDSVKYAVGLDYTYAYTNRDLGSLLVVYPLTGENVPNVENPVSIAADVTYLDLNIATVVYDEENKTYVDGDVYPQRVYVKDGEFENLGFLLSYGHYTFAQGFTHTFSDFGRCSILLFQTIGELITRPAQTIGNVGGIVAVGVETTNALKNYGFGTYIFYWGFISVNLAIFNLIPFPGLDGWQLLVLGIETIFKKKIPEKVKNMISLIGLALLLALMVFIVGKDIITYFILLAL